MPFVQDRRKVDLKIFWRFWIFLYTNEYVQKFWSFSWRSKEDPWKFWWILRFLTIFKRILKTLEGLIWKFWELLMFLRVLKDPLKIVKLLWRSLRIFKDLLTIFLKEVFLFVSLSEVSPSPALRLMFSCSHQISQELVLCNLKLIPQLDLNLTKDDL